MIAHDRLREAARALLRDTEPYPTGIGEYACTICPARWPDDSGGSPHPPNKCVWETLRAALAEADEQGDDPLLAKKFHADICKTLGLDGTPHYGDIATLLPHILARGWTEETLAEAIYDEWDAVQRAQTLTTLSRVAARVALRGRKP